MGTGSISFHESQVVYGVSEDCKFNDHLMCHNPRCGCSCHRAAKVDRDVTAVDHVAAAKVRQGTDHGLRLDKYCPKCHGKCPEDQHYCKIDGTRLSSLRCPECNSPGDETDNYCGYCGCGMRGDAITTRAAEVIEDMAMGIVKAGNPPSISIENDPSAMKAMAAALEARNKVVEANKSKLTSATTDISPTIATTTPDPRMFK